MFIFQRQSSAPAQQNISSQDRQNAISSIVSLKFDHVKDQAFNYAKKEKGYSDEGAKIYSLYAQKSLSSAIEAALYNNGVSPGKKIQPEIFAKIIKAVEDTFTADMSKVEKQLDVLLSKKPVNLIGSEIAISIEVRQEIQDPRKVAATLQKYGLDDSKLRSFLEQLPNAFAAYLSKGTQGVISYNIEHQLQTGQNIDFMQKVDENTATFLEKEGKKKRT